MLKKLNGTASLTWGDLKTEVPLKKAAILSLSVVAISILVTVLLGAIMFSLSLISVIMHIVAAAALFIGPCYFFKDNLLVKVFGEGADKSCQADNDPVIASDTKTKTADTANSSDTQEKAVEVSKETKVEAPETAEAEKTPAPETAAKE